MLAAHLESIHESATRLVSRDRGTDAAAGAGDGGPSIRDATEDEALLLEAEVDPSALAQAVLEDGAEGEPRGDEISGLLGAAVHLTELCDAPHAAGRVATLEERRDRAQQLLDEKCRELSQLEAESAAMAEAEQQLAVEQKRLEQELEAEQLEIRNLKASLAGKLKDVEHLMKELDELKNDMDDTEAELTKEHNGENEPEDGVAKDLLREIEEIEGTLSSASRRLQESEDELTAAQEELSAARDEGDGTEALAPEDRAVVHPNPLFMEVVRQRGKAVSQTGESEEVPDPEQSGEVESDILLTLEQAIGEIRKSCDLEAAAEQRSTLCTRLVEAVAESPEEAPPAEGTIEVKPSSKKLARGLLELARNGALPIPHMKRMLSPDGDDEHAEATRLLYVLVANNLVTLDRFAGESGMVRLA